MPLSPHLHPMGSMVQNVWSSSNPPSLFYVRGATVANIADLTAASVIQDGLTYVQGERILLAAQSTPAENGIYIVSAVTSAVAALTRAPDWALADPIVPGSKIFSSEGTANGNIEFFITGNDPLVVGTGDPGITATTAALVIAQQAPVRRVRGLVAGNVASLAAFAVSGNAYDDGLTYIAGDRVLLAGQTTAAQNGVYVVGTVSGTAPLTRATDMPAAMVLGNGSVVSVSEGTVWRGSDWKSMATTTGGAVIATNDPVFYPRSFSKVITLSSGTYIVGAGGGNEQLFLYSTTTSDVQATRNTAGGTLTLTTHYFAPVSGRIAGINPTAAVPVTASVAAGTINTADNSTINVRITNW